MRQGELSKYVLDKMESQLVDISMLVGSIREKSIDGTFPETALMGLVSKLSEVELTAMGLLETYFASRYQTLEPQLVGSRR